MGSKENTRRTLAELQGTRACDYWHHQLVDVKVYWKAVRQEWEGRFGPVLQMDARATLEDKKEHDIIVNVGSTPCIDKLHSFEDKLPFEATIRAHGEGERPQYYFLE